jgi:hypothetical protein
MKLLRAIIRVKRDLNPGEGSSGTGGTADNQPEGTKEKQEKKVCT